ncbi:RNB domain-containing ribonuclease [Corynebacterium sp. TA-R-1]|uniref:RNB domain-containing ribonuclease n=1 Tax=Corynebacterium stercoris TaxID=2943490 RepID=A0ABT1FYE2_9CORY|nr:RNB domain-containing ribonuclease [Corynebacterium stercoris]MCP1386785.1 RNB domain-containing ribonuclease [Corynebacterium stercoris]
MKLYAAPLNFRAIADEFDVPTDFAPEVVEEAARLTDTFAGTRRDARDIPLVTIDPPGSKDLDQAVYIEARGDGYRVLYAIADVAAFVEPDTLVKQESLIRGQTVYLPDEPARLHPAPLSEGSASLLPNVDRPAVLWTFDLDAAGEVEDAHVERALVHSVARLDYDGVQDAFRRGEEHPSIRLLPQVGWLRQQSSLRRAAINLRLPSVRVVEDAGAFELVIEPRHPVMDYNSEISLLTGMVAGRMMVAAGVGFLRTLGPAPAEAEAEFRREAANLGYVIAEDCGIGEFLAGVDADTPRGMAVMREAQKLLRGSGYVDLSEKEPEVHAGIGGYYSHVTAPLRRLIDRYATEVCLAICGGYEVPEWVTESAPQVIQSMARTSQLANTVDRAAQHLTEATVLAPWVGQNFTGVVLKRGEDSGDRARIFITDPPVLAPSIGAPPEGTETTFSLVRADPEAREVVFAWPAD